MAEAFGAADRELDCLIRDANKQIRSTKEHLKLQGHRGLLLIANDGNFLHTDPMNFMILVSRVLKKKKDGKPRFPHIDGVCYFSYRVGTKDEGPSTWAPRKIRPQWRKSDDNVG